MVCVIPRNHILVLPAELVTQTAHRAVLPPRLQPEHAECLGHHHALLVVVRRGHTLEGLEALKGLRATLGLVGDHAADGAPEHLGRGAPMPWATSLGVVSGLLAHEGLVLHCGRESRVSLVLREDGIRGRWVLTHAWP